MSSAAAPAAAPEEFPAGLRVLVVDDDVTCLRLLEQMLQRCRYRVTVCCRATLALSLLRERKDCYDVVISDVHMPDMDGYKLLELVGLEMDLPVIMMSADGRTSAVLRGINHGACDYLIKPVRIEELKNIWQHVARKKWQNKEAEHLGNLEDSDRQRRLNDRVDGTSKSQKKKRDVKENEDDGELDIEDPSTSKKPRVVWSVELHQQFISAVSQLGIEKAVPKRILELMNVPWLTRENVASHLQKFRQYLKRVAHHPGGVPNFFNEPIESNAAAGSVSRLNFQGLVASGQIPAQTLAALHEELLGQPSGGLLLPTFDKHHLFQTSFQGSKSNPIESDISFGLPLLKCGTEKLNHLPQASIAVENMSSGFSDTRGGINSTQNGSLLKMDTRGGINSTQNGSLLKMAVQQQQQSDAISAESCHAINIRPSVVLPPRADSFQINNMLVSLNQDTFVKKSSFTHTGVGERILLSSQYNNMPMSVAGLSDGVLKNVGMLDGSSTPGQLSSPSVSSSGSSRSVFTDINTGSEVLNSTVNFGPASRLTHQPNFCVLGSEAKTGTLPPRGHGRYLGFVGKKTCISSRFAVDDLDASTCNMDDRSTSIGDDDDRLKQGHYATTFFCK